MGIWLNTASPRTSYQGFPFLRHEDTARNLGVLDGAGPLEGANWDKWLALLQTRLGIAGRVTSILPGRALNLRAIFLAGVTFTSQFYRPLPYQVAELK